MTKVIRRYFAQSRDLFNSFLLVIPLFLFYQVGIIRGSVRNGSDFITPLLLSAVGGDLVAYLAINLVIFAVFGAFVWFRHRESSLMTSYWPWMLAESTLYALFFGTAVLQIMSFFQFEALLSSGGIAAEGGLFGALVMSAGAGFYEELVFRLIGITAIIFVLKSLVDWPMYILAGIAVAASSVLFAMVHHIGPLGDPFSMNLFLFRFWAGVLFAVIFYLRGFAIAAYTHAIYDVFVLGFG